MTKINVTGLVLGAMLATSLTACKSSDAEVLDAKAITHVVKTPREECNDEQVTTQKPIKDPKRVTGTIAGAIVGAVVGHQVGSGSGQDIATVAGAAAGGYAGNKVQKKIQNKTVTTTERVCKTVYDSRTEPTGSYLVRYRLNGKEDTVTMDHDPGSRIAVNSDGQLML